MTQPNFVKNVAIVGAGGNCGTFIAQELIKTGKHTVTAITRPESKATFPKGIHHITEVDYESRESLVDALRGQDVLIITMSVFAHKKTQSNLIEAAVEAGVGYILPNEWCPDTFNEKLTRDVVVFSPKPAIREKIQQLGKDKTSFIAITTSFWYAYMLALPIGFGFDFANKKVTFFDQGETKINVSTWPQIGRAVASLFSLPIEGKGDKCLSYFKNKQVRMSSFTLNQKDMLDSILRVTKDDASNWEITSESSETRYGRGQEMMKAGDRTGFAIAMSTRVFYKDGVGNYEQSKRTHNGLLDLPKEDLDVYTQEAITRASEKSPH